MLFFTSAGSAAAGHGTHGGARETSINGGVDERTHGLARVLTEPARWFFLRRLREIGRSTRARRATVVGGGLGDDRAANGLSRGRGRPPGPTPFHRGCSRRRGVNLPNGRTVGRRRWRPRCLFPVRLGRPEDGWSELMTPPRRY